MLRRAAPARASLLAVAALVVASVVLVACGGDDGGDAKAKPKQSSLERALAHAPVAPSPARVTVEDDFFVPKALKVRGGTEVTFANAGHRLHNVIPLDGGTFRVDTDELRPGMSKAFVLDHPGTYRYFCSIHGTATSGMRGILEVLG